MSGSRKASAGKLEQKFEAIFPGTSQKLAFTGVSAQSSALGVTTTIVRLVADADCFVLIGSNPTADAAGTSVFLPKGVVEYFGVDGSVNAQKIAAIQSSAGGNLWITEGAQ